MTDGLLPAATEIGRVALTVSDAAEVAEFYANVVGLSVQDRTDGRTVLGDGETALLELHEDADAPARPRSAAGLFHTAFRVPSRAALGDALARIESSWRLAGTADHLVSEALYLQDPEGNGVEIYRDRPRREWETTADGGVRMATDPLDAEGVRAAAAGEDVAPSGTDVGHVHLEVTDLDAARDFYVDGLGMTVRTTYEGAVFLAAGDYHHHVGANVWNGRSAPASGRGLRWYELVVPDADVLAAARDRLDAGGYDVDATDEGLTVTAPDDMTVRLRT